MKRMFEVVRGTKDQPKDEWEIVWNASVLSSYAPEYIQEVFVRRQNWDSAWLAKQYPGQTQYHYLMRQVPEDEDYKLRMSKRTDYVPFMADNLSGYFCAELDEDKNVVFYATENDARKDRRTTLKFKKFLRIHLGMGEYRVKDYCIEYGVNYADEFELLFTQDMETIRMVYREGPRSCMSGDSARNQLEVGAYAGDETGCGVAYLVRKTDTPDEVPDIVGRTVVNLTNQTYVCIYGAEDQMSYLLNQAGYNRSRYCMTGCRLSVITDEAGEEVELPYLDFSYGRCDKITREGKKYWLIQERNDY